MKRRRKRRLEDRRSITSASKTLTQRHVSKDPEEEDVEEEVEGLEEHHR